MTGLKRLEAVPFFQRDLIQHALSDVEIARVHANREFFDNFEAIVENDAKWAYRFQRRFDTAQGSGRYLSRSPRFRGKTEAKGPATEGTRRRF